MPMSDARETRPPSPRKHPLDYLIFIFLVATTIATGLAAYFTYRQWTTAHDTLVVSERAFVHFGGLTAFPTNTPDPTRAEFLGMFSLLINSGNTRTTGLEFSVRCVTSPMRLVEPWGFLHQEAEEHLPQVIAPKSSITAICNFKKSEVADIFAGKLFAYVLGDIKYGDIFDTLNRHLTQSSILVYITKYTETPFYAEAFTTPIGKHNCADEDCPK
jgi:hypothetical protein